MCELRMKKKDGTPIDVQLKSSVVPDKSGKPLEYRMTIVDTQLNNTL